MPMLRNIVSNWGGYLFSAIVGFFLSPYVVRHLGDAGYGVWSVLVSLTGYLGLLDLGVRGAVTRYIARSHAQADHLGSTQVASSAIAIFLPAGIVAIAVSAVLASFVIGRMNIPEQYLLAGRFVLLLLGVNVAFSLINGVYGGILVALQRFDLSNGIEVASTGLRAVAIMVALNHGFGLVTLACLQLFFTLARLPANLFLVSRLYPELHARPWSADRQKVSLIFSFSIFSFLLHVSQSLIYASDLVIIGAYLPAMAVTFYAIAGNLAEYARGLVAGITQTMTPLASSLEARKDGRTLQEIVLQSSSWATMVALPVVTTFFLRGSSFIALWMGPQYSDLSGNVLRVMAFSILFWASSSTVGSTMLGISRHKPMVPVALFDGLCNVAMSIFLVRRIGIIGVAWGTLIPGLFSSMLFFPWYLHHTLGIHPRRYVVSAWLKPGLAIIPFALFSYAIERFWPAHNLFLFFLQIALCMPLVLVCSWWMCLTSGQRAAYSRKFSLKYNHHS
jgi:O-antigen/teichoic acid export membrane protein